MDSSARDRYLTTEVMTATPQKLHLMLIDGTIRLAQQARRHWQAGGEDEKACEAIIRAQEIVTQLLAGLNRRENPDLSNKVAAVYLFIFQALVDAGMNRDARRLDEAVRVLKVERETWWQVCQQPTIQSGQSPHDFASGPAGQRPDRRSPETPWPGGLTGDQTIDHDTTGFSLEA